MSVNAAGASDAPLATLASWGGAMNLVRCDTVDPQPWRNGGGMTRELLAWPARDAWALRISVAEIHADGPFSAYPGVDRWFAVLQGAGVVLDLPAGRRSVTALDAPLSFRGEAAPQCGLLQGMTRDLNLMVRRDAGPATMQCAHAGQDFAPSSHFAALFSADALTLERAGGAVQALPAMSLAWTDDAAHGTWRIAAALAVRAFWITFESRPA